MANEVLSTDSNYSKAHVDAMIRKRLVRLGNDRPILQRFAQQETIKQGVGDTIRFLQMTPLDLPYTQLTEAQDPSKTGSAINYVEATVDHWGIVVGVSERLKIFTQFDVLSAHVDLVGRAMVRKREQEHNDVALSGTNVIYAGGQADRSSLTSSDLFTTAEIRKALANLFKTDGAKGEAPRYNDNKYVCLMHGDLAMDLQDDTIWETAMTRQGKDVLQDDPLMVADWQGVRFFVTNLFPEWHNAEDFTDGSDSLHDGSVTENDGGGSLGDFISIVVTAKHKKRLFEEKVYEVYESTDLAFGDDADVDIVLPSNDNYIYNVYLGDDDTSQSNATDNLALAAENQAAGAAVNVTSSPSGAAPPAVWVDGTATGDEEIRAALFLSPEAFAVAKLQVVEPNIVRGPDSGNVLNLFTDIGAKWRDKAAITDEDYMVRVEAHTQQTAST